MSDTQAITVIAGQYIVYKRAGYGYNMAGPVIKTTEVSYLCDDGKGWKGAPRIKRIPKGKFVFVGSKESALRLCAKLQDSQRMEFQACRQISEQRFVRDKKIIAEAQDITT